MSWIELERLVASAESHPDVRHRLGLCRDARILVLEARRMGYRITAADLRSAWRQHRRQQRLQSTPAAMASRRLGDGGRVKGAG